LAGSPHLCFGGQDGASEDRARAGERRRGRRRRVRARAASPPTPSRSGVARRADLGTHAPQASAVDHDDRSKGRARGGEERQREGRRGWGEGATTAFAPGSAPSRRISCRSSGERDELLAKGACSKKAKVGMWSDARAGERAREQLRETPASERASNGRRRRVGESAISGPALLLHEVARAPLNYNRGCTHILPAHHHTHTRALVNQENRPVVAFEGSLSTPAFIGTRPPRAYRVTDTQYPHCIHRGG